MNEKVVFVDDEGVINELPRVKHWLNASRFPKDNELGGGKSMTVPDQSYTIRELMDRFARGLPVEGQRQDAFYDEDSDFPDINKMEFWEVEELRQRYRDELELINQRLKDQHEKDIVKEKVADVPGSVDGSTAPELPPGLKE